MNGRVIAGIALVAVVGAVLAATGVFSGDGGGSAANPDSESDSGFGSAAASPDPTPPPPPPRVRRYDVGGRPDSISAGAGYAWAADSTDGSLKRINPRSKRPITVEVAGFPTDVSADEDAAWVALADRGAVQRVSGTEGAAEPVEVAGFPFRIAAGEGSVWAMSQTSIERIDPASLEVGAALELGGDLASIAAGEGGVWVVRGGDEVVKLDAESGQRSASAEVPGAFSVAVGESAAWALGRRATGGSGDTLTRIDPAGSVSGQAISVARAVDVAAGLGFVWVLGAGGELARYEPGSGLPVGEPVNVGERPLSVSVGEGSAWVAAAGEGAVYRVTP